MKGAFGELDLKLGDIGVKRSIEMKNSTHDVLFTVCCFLSLLAFDDVAASNFVLTG